MSSAQSQDDFSERLSFLAEWFDHETAYEKRFLLNYYPCDNTFELFDRDLDRIYLKRSVCKDLNFKDLFVGNTVRIYGRQIKIIDYGDSRTEKAIGHTRQHTFTLVKPSAVAKIGEIINQIQDKEFRIVNIRLCQMDHAQALELFEPLKGDAFLPFIIDHLASGLVVAIELVGDDAVARWQRILGPSDPAEARRTAPESLRAIYGIERASNAFHGARNHEDALRESQFFFPGDSGRIAPQPPLQLNNSTCCVIKPHAILEGNLGHIISFISDSKFKITAMQSFTLSSVNAEEFLEVYKGVVTDFHALLLSFLDGPCVALEVSAKSEDLKDVHGEFRKFVGPSDSDVARQIRPNTLRAKFGLDKYKNAVHCTDLPEDTVLELEYFFKILS